MTAIWLLLAKTGWLPWSTLRILQKFARKDLAITWGVTFSCMDARVEKSFPHSLSDPKD